MPGSTPRPPADSAFTEHLHDRLSRPLSDLRVSVTDRCNFRCRYCMPRESVPKSSFLPRADILRFEEIVRIARIFVNRGVQKIRLTGGEPLLRRNLPRLVEQLAELGVDLALTTNGVLLAEQARDLARAGLGRITVSLDALDDVVFQRMSDAPGYCVGDVLRGIEAAEASGFHPIKINCVVRKGSNESEVLPLLERFAGTGHILRFIEFMDVGTRNEWAKDEVMTQAQLENIIRKAGELSPLSPESPHEVARRYTFRSDSAHNPEALMELGMIASVSRPFCAQCSRARLSADGKLYTCLFAGEGHDLRASLRGGHSDETLDHEVCAVWSQRADRYSELRAQKLRTERHLPVIRAEMSYIGG